MYPSARRSLSRRLALAGAVSALALLPSGSSIAVASTHAPSAAAGVPPATASFYVYGSFIDVCGLSATTECPLYNDAAREAVPPGGGMTILDLGAPCFEPATSGWGTQLFNSQSCTPDATLVVLAQAWLRGYASNPGRPASPPYVLALGTSNSLTAAVPGNALSAGEMALHGHAWFTSLIAPVAEAARNLPFPVTIWAGDDIEESSDGNWYDGATTAAWVDAYAAVAGASKPCVPTRPALMVDYGDYVPGEPGWSPAAVYHVSWGARPSCPVPEIYRTVNADEWQSLNEYAASAGLPQLEFTGVLSQNGAGGTLSSSASWDALRAASGQAPPYLSAIGVTGPIRSEVPDAPTVLAAVPGPGLVSLRWSAPAWDGGAAVTAYAVSVYAGSTLAEEVTFSGFPAAETGIVSGLANGTPYTFYVTAINRVGKGPRSLPSGTVAPSALFPMR